MRTSPQSTPSPAVISPQSAHSDRAVRAAHLLHEALALLAEERGTEIAVAHRLPDRLLRLPEVQRLTGLRRSAVYEQMQRGAFPRSVKTGRRSAGWSESAIQAWIAARIHGGML